MAEPRTRADQHEHVEAENRLHNEAVILYLAGYMSQYLIHRSEGLDWLRVEIYQPYISLVGGCFRGCR
jgi:hypothetical protein